MASTGQLGITAPISYALPTEADLRTNVELIAELRRQNQYESDADTKKRMVVLASLQKITEEFVRHVGTTKGTVTEKSATSRGGKIFTYGGYPLGVYGPGSDIDALVVAPKGVQRSDFFQYYPEVLLKMAPKDSITQLSVVTDAHVPIISFAYNGISIDLNFCEVYLPRVAPDLEVSDNKILRGLDSVAAKAINGTRVAMKLRKLVPEIAVFKVALKCVKLWAKQRGLYANIVGFPGGIAWAIMVAFVCQLYPKATSSTIVLKFFFIMKSWPWPRPIVLNHIETDSLGFEVWGAGTRKNYDFMPVITPAYPAMCSTYNVTPSTLAIINRELKRAWEITDRVMIGKSQWRELFVKHTFFTQDFSHYLAVISASTTEEAQLKWKGFVQSKVRLLVKSLESHASIDVARPFISGFERVHRCHTEAEVEQVKEGKIISQVEHVPTVVSDLTHDPNLATAKEGAAIGDEKLPADDKTTTVYTTTYYIGLEMYKGARSLDLGYQVDRFKALCTGWEKHDPTFNALNIKHFKATELPDDIFAEGEVKRLPKKAANGTKTNVNKKRPASDDVSNSAKRQSLASGVQ